MKTEGMTEAEIDAARNRTTGESMRDALAKAGYAGRPRLKIDPRRYAGTVPLRPLAVVHMSL